MSAVAEIFFCLPYETEKPTALKYQRCRLLVQSEALACNRSQYRKKNTVVRQINANAQRQSARSVVFNLFYIIPRYQKIPDLPRKNSMVIIYQKTQLTNYSRMKGNGWPETCTSLLACASKT